MTTAISLQNRAITVMPPKPHSMLHGMIDWFADINRSYRTTQNRISVRSINDTLLTRF